MVLSNSELYGGNWSHEADESADYSSSLNETGIPRWRSAELVEGVFEVIKETLESGEDVLISGFGKWSVEEKNERRGRNPQTGESIVLAPRKVVTFKCASVLKDKLNGKR